MNFPKTFFVGAASALTAAFLALSSVGDSRLWLPMLAFGWGAMGIAIVAEL